MAFNKVIPQLCIQPVYQAFIDEFLNKTSMLFSDDLHSIYMCGSIPKGQAKYGQSDADFTFVFIKTPSESILIDLESLKKELLSVYPFVTKIDTPICLVSDVFNKPYEWGFWIKIICICVHGIDLGQKLPDYRASQNLIMGLNSDTEAVFRKLLKKFTKKPSYVTGRNLAKRVLRAMYTLTLDRVESWEDDFVIICDTCIRYFPQWKKSLGLLTDFVMGIESTDQDLMENSEKLYKFVMVQSNLRFINIQDSRDSIPQVSQWIFEEFIDGTDPDISLTDMVEAIGNRPVNHLPMTFIVKAGSLCIGTVSLFEYDLNERLELSPWLSALYVEKDWRRFGVGFQLIELVQNKAVELGYDTLYLRTEKTGKYYEKHGWKRLEKLIDEYGQDVTVYQKSTRFFKERQS